MMLPVQTELLRPAVGPDLLFGAYLTEKLLLGRTESAP
jgi:hypothetical protein